MKDRLNVKNNASTNQKIHWNVLQKFEQLSRFENFVVVQAKVGKTGFRDYLFKVETADFSKFLLVTDELFQFKHLNEVRISDDDSDAEPPEDGALMESGW